VKTVIVTGGLGYIGSHTVVELINEGYEVVVLDNLSNSSESVVDGIRAITKKSLHFFNVDLRDYDKLEAAIGYYQQSIVGVIHFAACKSVGESMKNPSKYYDNNVAGTNNLLMAMKRYDARNLIFSSSCTVYGEADELPVTEQTPQKPAESVYGRTKQICEQMIKDMHREYNYNSVLLRYFNPIGAHETALIGELPNGSPDNLLPFIAETAIGKRDSFTVFGDDYDTEDGTCVRDYLHVVDLAKAHVMALEASVEKNLKAVPVNLGTGKGYSVKQVLEAFEKENDIKVNTHYGNRRKGDVEAIYADASYAEELLGWKAKLGLKEMVTSVWKWQKAISSKCCGGGCGCHSKRKV
jgi:UDP-glucose 4-epimerase|tara:strand:+ start:354 stop:1412 length:1059 start_codon:yes stop_codon:yes gene_type:complete